jgi:hypothetical protein
MQGGWSCCFPQLTAVLFFSCSCLVSSSLTSAQWGGTVQFWMLLSGSGDQLFNPLLALLWDVACCCVCSLRVQCWEFSFLSHPLSVGQVQHSTVPLHYPCLISVHCVLFQFGGAVRFWMLLFGSGVHLCDPLPALLWEVVCCPTSTQALLPFLCLFTENLALWV